MIEWIDILKMFPLIDRYGGADVEGRILEAGALLQSSNIATKQAGSASVQTANKHVPASRMIALLNVPHSCCRDLYAD